MNKTYQEDTDTECWLCGGTIELHVASAQCSNFKCPSNSHNIRSPPVTQDEDYYLGQLLIRFGRNLYNPRAVSDSV